MFCYSWKTDSKDSKCSCLRPGLKCTQVCNGFWVLSVASCKKLLKSQMIENKKEICVSYNLIASLVLPF